MKTADFRRAILFGVVFLLLLATAAVWKYFGGRASADKLVLSGTIEADEIHVGSKVGGRIAAVLVKEGQEVRQGEPLIRFDRYDLDAKRADAVAAVAQADANLQKTLNWSRPEEVAEPIAHEIHNVLTTTHTGALTLGAVFAGTAVPWLLDFLKGHAA